MAKNFEHLIHKNSNVVVEGAPKLPTSGQIEYGELAVNYAKDKETISLKNSDNEIVTFSSDAQIQSFFKETEEIIANALNDLNSRITTLTSDVDEIELGAASALNDLDKRITETNSSITELGSAIDEMDEVTASSLNDLNGRIINIEDDVETVAEELESDVDQINTRLTTLENTPSGDANVIETVKVNGTALVPDANKAVNVTVPTETSVSGWGFTKNTGTVTGVKINGTTNNPTNGVVDLGTVITSHQDISGKANTADLATVATSGSYNDLTDKPTIPTNYAGSTEAGGTANKTASIPYAQVDSTSTATVFTATVDGITELRDGVCCLLKNGIVTSATGFTLNINNLGAKPCYSNLAAAARETTIFNEKYTMLFVYDSTRVDGGCWICYKGYDSNSDTDAYDVREYYSGSKKLKTAMQRYQLVMTTMDDMLLPVYSGAYTTATTKVLTTESFNPFGQIYYYGVTANIAAGGGLQAGNLYAQAAYTLVYLNYSFNTGSTLTAGDDIYLVCVPQNDGSVKLHNNPIAKSLPTTEDGLVYKRLGKAYDTSKIILELDKPCYYYKNGAIRLWTNTPSTVTSVKMNGTTNNPTNGVVDLGTVITSHQDISGKADKSAAIGSLSLSLNSTNYQITLSGTKVDGTAFTVSDVIDLPLESVVVNGSYNNTTKKVVLTLQNGSTVEFSVADLVAGLQSEITSTNKLSADLISDGTTNKTVTATEKSTWNGKQDALSNANVLSGITSTKVSNWDSAATNSHTHSNKSVLDGINATDITNWNSKTDNVGTVTGVKMNGTTNNPTNGVVDLGTVITSETQLRSLSEGKGNVVTDISVSGHLITFSKGTFLERETQLSKGTTTGTGNAVTDISVRDHQITLTKGTTFLTQHQDISGKANTADLATVATSGSYNDLTDKPTIPTVNDPTITLTFNGSTVGTFTLNQSGNQTIDIGSVIGLPSFSAANNGQILGVVNGALTWVTPSTIYTGTGTPSSTQGNDGDIYLQTS